MEKDQSSAVLTTTNDDEEEQRMKISKGQLDRMRELMDAFGLRVNDQQGIEVRAVERSSSDQTVALAMHGYEVYINRLGQVVFPAPGTRAQADGAVGRGA